MSTFLIMPMGSQLVPVNGTASCLNGSTVYNVNFCAKQNIPYQVKPLERITIKKKSMSPAQERNNILLNEMRDKIDRDHLQIDTNGLFRSAVGTFWSFNKIGRLDCPQIINELTTIQSYITVEDKEYIFQKLEGYHYYVNMLLQIAVEIKIKEIKNVNGNTLDTVFYTPKQNGFKRLVHIRAFEQYFSDMSARDSDWIALQGGLKKIQAADLVQRAFDNSVSSEELRALHSSKVFVSMKDIQKVDFGKKIIKKLQAPKI